MTKQSKVCKECRFRIRGKGHKEGAHHQGKLGQIRHASKS